MSSPAYIVVDGYQVTVDYPLEAKSRDCLYLLPFQRTPEIQRLGLMLGKISAVLRTDSGVVRFWEVCEFGEPEPLCLRWQEELCLFEMSAACGEQLSNVEDEGVAGIPAGIHLLHCYVGCSNIIRVQELKLGRKTARARRRVQMLLTLREIVRAAGLEAEMRDLMPGIVLAAWPRLEWL